MSFPVSLKLQIEGDADVQNKIKALNKEMSGLGKGAGQATRPMQQMSKSVDGVSKSTDQASKGVKGYSKELGSVTKTTKEVDQGHRSMGQKVQGAAGGFALAGSAAVSLWNAYDNVTDSATKVEIAENRVAGTELRLSRAREALNKLQQSGTASSVDLAQAQAQVEVAEGNVERAAFNLTNAQEALNESYLNAATSVIPAVFTGMSGLGQIMDSFRGSTETVTDVAIEASDSFTELGGSAAELGSSVTEVGGGFVEVGGAATEMSANVAEAGSDFTELGGTIAETGADIGEFAGDATELGGAITEVGSAAVEGGANVAELGADIAEVGGSAVEATADVTEFSGDMLELSGNAAEAGGASLELSSNFAEVGGAATAAGIGLKGFAVIAGAVVGALAAFAASVVIYKENLFGVADAGDLVTNTLESIIPGTKQAAEGFNSLVDPVYDLWNNWIKMVPGAQGVIDKLKGQKEQAGDTAGALETELNPAIEKTNAELNKLSPMAQQAAQAWGLYNNELAATDPGMQRQIQHLQALDKALEPARQGVIDLAVANGVDLQDALAMTDEQMIEFIGSSENLGPTMEMQAEMSAAAAQKFADDWIASFERVSEAQREFGSSMRSAMGKMGQELGEEMEVGLSDLEKTVSKGLVGFSDQFFEEIFPEDFLATAIIEGNDPDDIAKELKDLMDDVVDEDIVTKDQAKTMLQPMIDYFAQDLPADVEAPLAYMAGQLPSLIADWEPAIVNGVVAVGAAGKQAIDEHLIQPMQLGLQNLASGESGLDFGRAFLDNVRRSLPAIEAQAGPEIAELMQGLLDAKNMGLDQKVQGIIDVMDQIRPGFKETIMGMDRDADGIADIMDDKVLTPVDQMRLGILEAFRDVAQAAGDLDLASALGEQIFEITGNVADLGEASGLTAGELGELDRAAREGRAPLAGLGTDAGTAAEAAKTAATTWGGWRAEVVGAGNAADTAAGQIRTLTGDAQTFSQGWTGQFTGKGAAATARPLIDTEAMKTPFNQLLEFLSTWKTNVQNALSQWDFSSMQTAWSGLWTNHIQPAMTTVTSNIGLAKTGILNVLSQWDFSGLNTAWAHFSAGIINIVEGVSQYLGPWVARIQAIMGGWDWAGFVSKWNELAATVSAKTAQIWQIVDTWNKEVVARVNALDWSGFIAKWNELAGIVSSKTAAVWSVVDTWNKEVVKLVTTWDFSGLKTAFDGIWGKIQPGLQGAYDEVQKIAGQIAAAISSIYDAAAGAGGGTRRTKAAHPSDNRSIVEKLFGTSSSWEQAGAEHGRVYFAGHRSAINKTSDQIFQEYLRGTTGSPEEQSRYHAEAEAAFQHHLNELGQQVTGRNWGDDWATFMQAVQGIFGGTGEFFTQTEEGVNAAGEAVAQGQADMAATLAFLDLTGLDKYFGTDGIVPSTYSSSYPKILGDALNFRTELEGILNRPIQGPKVPFQLAGPGGGGGAAQVGTVLAGGKVGGAAKLGGAGDGGAGGATAGMTAALQTLQGEFQRFRDAAVQAIDAVGLKLGTLAQGFSQLLLVVQTGVTQMAVGWLGHAAAVGAQVTATITHMANLATEYVALQTGVAQVLASNNQVWSAHAGAVGAHVGAVVGHMANLAREYVSLRNGVAQVLASNNQVWSAHAGAVGAHIRNVVGHMANLAREYVSLRTGVSQVLNTVGSAWSRHSSAVRSATSNSSSAVRSLASAVRSSMSSVSSSMNNATSAANRLRNAINSLRNRTVTVTTRYRTVGRPAAGTVRAATGFSGVVTQPTRMFVGEGNKPELVQVTPLSASGGRVNMNKAAATAAAASTTTTTTGKKSMTSMIQSPTIRSGLSTGIQLDNPLGKFSKIFRDTIEDWIDNFGYEINKFSRDKMGKVTFELAGGKNFKRIHEDRAEKFANKRGYIVSDYRARKTKNNNYLNMTMVPYAGGGGGGGGGGPPPAPGSGSTFAGADAMHSLKYVFSTWNQSKMIRDVQLYEDGTGRIFYSDGSFGTIKHMYPGPFGRDVRGLQPTNTFPSNFVGPYPVQGKLPNPNIKTKDGRLHEDMANAWAQSWGYSLVEYRHLKHGLLGMGAKVWGQLYRRITRDIAESFVQNHDWRLAEGGYKSVVLTGGKHLAAVVAQSSATDSSGKAIKAASGFSGIVSKPTQFLAGERGRESVNIQPLTQNGGAGGGGGGGGRGRGGGRPVVIQLNIRSELDGRVITESVRKELLGGIYSMT